MWDYILFFGLNGIAFLISLLIWEITPKPKPEDYTTVPGDKPSETGADNIIDIRNAGTFLKYLRQLHTIYGPLASFYWNGRQIISVTSVKLIGELQEHTSNLVFDNDRSLSQILGTKGLTETDKLHSQIAASKRHRINESELQSCVTHFVETSIKYGLTAKQLIEEFTVFFFFGKWASKHVAADKQFELLYEYFDEQESELCGYATKQKARKTLTSLLKQAIEGTHLSTEARAMEIIADISAVFRCLHFVAAEIAETKSCEITRLVQQEKHQAVIDEIIRMAVPVPLLANRYVKEIDIDGHPIPALTPVLISGDYISYDEHVWTNPNSFVSAHHSAQSTILQLILGKDAEASQHTRSLIHQSVQMFCKTVDSCNISIVPIDGVLTVIQLQH